MSHPRRSPFPKPNEPWSEQESELVDRHKGATCRFQRGRVGAGGSAQVLSKSHQGYEAQEPDHEEGGLHDASRDVPHRSDLALSLDDRIQHDRSSDVGDEQEELEHRP